MCKSMGNTGMTSLGIAVHLTEKSEIIIVVILYKIIHWARLDLGGHN